MQSSGIQNSGNLTETTLREEVEKRYLAYALSTIVSRALPDVRDGLKPVHRRILYAMQSMHLTDAAKMRKSAAVVGEVIGKYHPHGDQAAYDALVRMAQDFSLRYPLIDGSGNFGSLDGDSPAAMRYTETRLSAFAGLLMREIDQGTTDFRPTYDAMGEEPDVLPALVPNLLLNGSSGIAVGMSCSFPPHNLREIVAACRAAIRNRDITVGELLKHVQGPDFPTGAELVTQPDRLEQLYTSGHGALTVRATYTVENQGRGRINLIVTSIPYSVNKSRLIERIASLIRDKKLKQVHDVRDESTSDVRVVIELRGGDVKHESVMAFLYRHTDLQINFPVNLIAITPQGVPDRLGLDKIIRYFLDFRYDKTVRRLTHRLELLRKRIHVLEGFELLFLDLDLALRIIRGARSRHEAETGLKSAFGLDVEQIEAVLEMKLYRLVGMEMDKVLEELAAKRKEGDEIALDLGSSERLWKIIDTELADVARKIGDNRRTAIVHGEEACALQYDPDEFVEHEDTTVILSRQGWIRRMKSLVDDASTLKFREGDALFGCVRTNTGRTVAIFSSLGKVYVMRAIDIPATTGFGEPIGSLLSLVDGECVVGLIAPDGPAREPRSVDDDDPDDRSGMAGEEEDQLDLFAEPESPPPQPPVQDPAESRHAVLVTRHGKGFRFGYEILLEPSKRVGRKLVALQDEDETLVVLSEDGELLALGSSSGYLLLFPKDEIPVLAGPGQGVRMMKLTGGAQVVAVEWVSFEDRLRIQPARGAALEPAVADIPPARRGGQGKKYCAEIVSVEKISVLERHIP